MRCKITFKFNDMSDGKFQSFADFYPFYLSEHSLPICRALHYIGTSLGLSLVLYFVLLGRFASIPLALIPGYAFAWIGHFVFEKNRPATFKYPLYSFLGDWVMLKDFLVGIFAPEKGLPKRLKELGLL